MMIYVIIGIGTLNLLVILLIIKGMQKHATDEEGLLYYDVYSFKWAQLLCYCLIYGTFGAFVGYVFYRHVNAVLILSFAAMWLVMIKRKGLIQKQKDILTIQFKDAIYIISTSISVGKSFPNAIGEACVEMGKLYFGHSAYMVRELEVMYSRLSMNTSIESVFNQFDSRAHIEDIHEFTNVLTVGRKKGANINELIRKTSQIIGDKIQIQRDITTALTAKRFEFRIMTLMPLFFIAFLTKSSPDLMEPVYSEALGRIAMTIALVLFGIAYVIAEKLVKIEV